MRRYVVAAALFLAACGQSADQQAAGGAAPAASGASPAAASARPSPFPQWLQIANQAGGGAVYYHPASIVRTADAGAAEVWTEIVYANDQTYVIEDKTTKQTITYTRERILFRFDCNRSRYVIVERRLMGAGEQVAETIKSPPEQQNDWLNANAGGVTGVALGPACKADIKAP